MSPNEETEACWICGEATAQTREHRTKASDIKSELGEPTVAQPFYFHDGPSLGSRGRRNRQIRSLKSRHLKFNRRICGACNNSRTQPHDYAWELASSTLRRQQSGLLHCRAFRANWLFPYNTRSQMGNMHLFFVKLFGCQIIEGGIAIDIQPFSAAIRSGKPHPDMFLSIGRMSMPMHLVGGSDVAADLRKDGQVAFASWFYQVGELTVNLLYAPEDQRHRPALRDAWHPHQGCKRLVFIDWDARHS